MCYKNPCDMFKGYEFDEIDIKFLYLRSRIDTKELYKI